MKLTNVEQVDLMKRSCAINGCSLSKLGVLMQSSNKADESKVAAVAKTMEQLKSMQIAKKIEMRSDKGSKSALKELSSRLTPYQAFIAQTKKPESAKDYAWIQRVFERGSADQAEQIAMMSQSCISSMKAIDPFTAEASHAASVSGTGASASAFCKRFGIGRK